MKKKILISTGGSGGHVTPAITLYEHLKSSFQVLVSSDKRGYKYFDKNTIDPLIIDTPKLSRFHLIIINFPKILILIIKSFLLIKKHKIELLISTGGYMSLPLCLGAKLSGTKIFLLEPNMVLGRSNRLFLSFSEKIFCYSKNLKKFPIKFQNKIVLINPLIRKNFFNEFSLNKDSEVFNILIVGGSQGAKLFDEIIKESILKISKKFNIKIFQQTNSKNIEFLKNFYDKNNIKNFIFDFNQNFYDLLKKIDLCVSRAGASTLAELALMEIPFIAIPLLSSKDNHQYENAIFYKDLNCCWILNQKKINKDFLSDQLIDIIKNKDEYYEKKKNLNNLNYRKSWNYLNNKILETLNEN